MAIRDVRRQTVAPGFFELLDIRLIAGRTLTADDASAIRDRIFNTVINETMSRHFGGPEEAIGRQIRWGGPGSRQPLQTIVGVVEDVRLPEVDAAVSNQVYDASLGGFANAPGNKTLFIKTAGDPNRHVGAITEAIRSIDPSEPEVVAAETLETVLRDALAPRRYQLLLAGLLAAAAVALALTGLLGVMSHAVARRTREIGVRLALGAHGGRVLREVIADALRLALLGIAIGLPAAWAFGRVIESELFGVTLLNPAANLVAVVGMLAAAFVAAYAPARRAASLDPVEALRRE